MAPIKQQWKELNLVRLLAESLIAVVVAVGLFWAVLVVKGNEIWASKEKTAAQFFIVADDIQVLEVESAQHATREAVAKEYVSRVELSSTQRTLTAQTKELKDDFHDFAKEQRAVNREILQRLP